MSIQLQARLNALEAEVKSLRLAFDALLAAMTEQERKPAANANGPRQMCPHCGTKPAYYMHVRACRAKHGAVQKQE